MRPLRLALAQMNPTVGDLEGNTRAVLGLIDEARQRRADIAVFPELAVTGYPPEDLLLRPQFLADAKAQLDRIVAASHGVTVIVGAPELVDGRVFNPGVAPRPDEAGGRLYNGAAVAADGRLVHIYRKIFLPNYGVFDEERYFQPGNECSVFEINGVRVGVNVCEDIWHEEGPGMVQRGAGAEVIVNINASPYHRGKGRQREEMLAARARTHGAYIAYLNTVGGQDELVFDGQSLVIGPDGAVVARGPQFTAEMLIVDVDADRTLPPSFDGAQLERARRTVGAPASYHVSGPASGETRTAPDAAPSAPPLHEPMDPLAEVYAALVTGTRDYVLKSGFHGAVIGLSGGIDSALTTTIAVDALGADSVTTFFMPSRFTSDQSEQDSRKLTANLGVRMEALGIESGLAWYLSALGPLFEGLAPDVAEENLQARIRGNLLMAASNKFGWIVLTTGNKSEMATGYATLYGDMAGGFAVIKDVPKTLVQQLARHRNATAGWDVIPEPIIVRPPTAELRADQKDEDSLPPYAVLDPILQAYVEDDWTVGEMLEAGMPADAVLQTIQLVNRSEYKRRQAPPGVKITRRNFGRDRRLPIVNRYTPHS